MFKAAQNVPSDGEIIAETNLNRASLWCMGAQKFAALLYTLIDLKGPLMSNFRRGQIRLNLRNLSLSTALVSAISLPATAQQYLANGEAIVLAGDQTLKTTGDSETVLSAINGGSVTSTGALRIVTSGNVSLGAFADNGTVSLSGGSIETSGNYSYGLRSHQGAEITASNGVAITTTGLGAWGASAMYGSSIHLNDSSILTLGVGSYGISSVEDSLVEGNGVSIRTMGEGSFGVGAGAYGTIDLSRSTVLSYGERANGMTAVANGSIKMADSTIGTSGSESLGAFVNGSSLELTRSHITTGGFASDGIVAESGSVINLAQSSVVTHGDIADGMRADGESNITAVGTYVNTFGANSVGISLADGSTAKFASSNIATTDGPALRTESGATSFEFSDGSSVRGGSNVLLEAAQASDTTLKADGNVQLYGDMIAETDDTVIEAALSNKSQWFGAAKVVKSVSVDATSSWLMTGSSVVGELGNDGVVDFDAANPYKTLTVGNLAMNGGSFILNTKLNEGGEASETDKIVVTGDATGNGLINIQNNGGSGAYTGTGATDGIQVVEVGGASDAEFKLGSAAVVGIYDYQLKKADGQNWYLQTEGSDVVDPPACTPGVDCPGDGGDDGDGTGNPGPGTGHVVDIVPGYNIALSAAQNHVLTSLDTFHERLGELRAEELQDGYHAWMRGIGKTGSYSPKSITGYNGHGFDMTTAGVQIGADYSKSDVFVAGDKLTIGMFGEYANSSFDVRGRTADGSISSKGLGGYVTWQQKAPTDRKPGTGAYVDAVVKQDWLEFGVNAKSVSGFDMQNGYKGKATTASIETGYGFDLGNNVVLQPQAQLTWSKVKADSFSDSYGIAVHGQEAESLIGRVGVRLEKTFYFGDDEETVEAAPVPAPKAEKQVKGKKGRAAKAVPAVLPEAPKKKFVKSVTTYANANVKHEFKGKNGLVASNTGIGNDMGGTRYDVGVGVVARVSENVSLFGRGSVEFGGSTNVARKVSGGLKISF